MNIILFDIETSPMLGAFWNMYETNPLWVDERCKLLCFAWKKLNDRKIHCPALPDYGKVRKGHLDDRKLVEELWRVLDDADVVVAHNATRFDVKMANSFFAQHKLLPPSPYEVVDTLSQARSVFKFNSNKLDNLGDILNLGRKVAHEGKELWRKCMDGDSKAWKKMVTYCKQDVNLLEDVYLELLPWMKRHPNIGLYQQDDVCPRCGGNHVHKKAKRAYKQVFVYQRYRCSDCGAWLQGERILKDFKPRCK